jgi:hypothetical protein
LLGARWKCAVTLTPARRIDVLAHEVGGQKIMRRVKSIWALGIAAGLALAACGGKGQSGGTGGDGGTGNASSGTGAAGGTGGAGGAGGTGGAGATGGTGGNGATGGMGGAGQGGAGQGGAGGGGSQACADAGRMDLVLAIDNSRSMADKQQILARTVPDLVGGLVNPLCLDAAGQPVQGQPASALDPCPAGSERAFPPRLDVHIGIIDSSIGGHGSDACPDVVPNSKECSPNPNYTNNDKGHLLSRLNPCGGASAPTYQSKGFLAWDPTQQLNPPGEKDLDNGMGGGLVPTLRNMVNGVGQIGCGYESQLESIYRFLADPAPYETIQVVNNKATPMGTDNVLLQQRAEFLRPDSLLTVIMLTDENDCSTKEYGQYYYVNQLRVGATSVRLPRARQECATNPNDPCCKSCGQSAGNCPADPTCIDAQGQVALYSAEEDPINLRCWDQKRRFGIDFNYPIDRYKQAFTSAMIPNLAGDLVPNPIFSDLNPNDNITKIRGPEEVLVTGIVGVPWQDLARDKNDLKKGFKTAAELSQPIAGVGGDTWDVILGDPASYVPPKDPFMIESTQKRSGTNPITGDSIVDASGTNSINGHDWTTGNEDLQYACIFQLPPGGQRDCTDPSLTACDCVDASNDNPLCQNNPANNTPTVQARAKGYPGIRQLSLLKALGDQATVGSVCPAQVTDDSSSDFGYRPALNTVLEWLTRRGCKVANP